MYSATRPGRLAARSPHVKIGPLVAGRPARQEWVSGRIAQGGGLQRPARGRIHLPCAVCKGPKSEAGRCHPIHRPPRTGSRPRPRGWGEPIWKLARDFPHPWAGTSLYWVFSLFGMRCAALRLDWEHVPPRFDANFYACVSLAPERTRRGPPRRQKSGRRSTTSQGLFRRIPIGGEGRLASTRPSRLPRRSHW